MHTETFGTPGFVGISRIMRRRPCHRVDWPSNGRLRELRRAHLERWVTPFCRSAAAAKHFGTTRRSSAPGAGMRASRVQSALVCGTAIRACSTVCRPRPMTRTTFTKRSGHWSTSSHCDRPSTSTSAQRSTSSAWSRQSSRCRSSTSGHCPSTYRGSTRSRRPTRAAIRDASVPSLSCLHVAEHVGTRPVRRRARPAWDRARMRGAHRVLAPGGSLLFSLPVGRPRVCFNAHRVHAPTRSWRTSTGSSLDEFSVVDDAYSWSATQISSTQRRWTTAAACSGFAAHRRRGARRPNTRVRPSSHARPDSSLAARLTDLKHVVTRCR